MKLKINTYAYVNSNGWRVSGELKGQYVVMDNGAWNRSASFRLTQ